jgi:alkaline phosphatase D
MKLTTGLLLLILGAAHAQTSTPLTRIAFGSCSRNELKQLWPDVVAQDPQLWIWGGDNIYGDSHDASVLRKKYDAQKRDPGYQMLLKTCPVIGTWDDHDYGVNDGGKYFSKKEESKTELLRFLDVPPNIKMLTKQRLIIFFMRDPLQYVSRLYHLLIPPKSLRYDHI